MRSDIRSRLGRILAGRLSSRIAGIGTLATAAVLSTAYSSPAIAEESPPTELAPPPPAAETSAPAEQPSPAPVEPAQPAALAQPEVAPALEPSPDAPSPSQAADLSITATKTGSNRAGFTIEVTVENLGSDDATDVNVSNENTDVALTIETSNDWTCTGNGEVNCSINSIPGGQSRSFVVSGSAINPTPGKTGTAVFSLDDSDVNPDNNVTSISHTVPNDFGGIVIGRVWHDSNSDGLQNQGESGLGGVTITLVNGNTPISSVRTDGDGNYSFGNVLGGNVSVVVGSLSGFEFTPVIGGSPGNNSDVDSGGIAFIGEVGDFGFFDIDAGLRSVGGGGTEPPPNPGNPPPANPSNPPPSANPENVGAFSNTQVPGLTRNQRPGSLARTGTQVADTVTTGAALIAGGTVLFVLARGRRKKGTSGKSAH